MESILYELVMKIVVRPRAKLHERSKQGEGVEAKSHAMLSSSGCDLSHMEAASSNANPPPGGVPANSIPRGVAPSVWLDTAGHPDIAPTGSSSSGTSSSPPTFRLTLLSDDLLAHVLSHVSMQSLARLALTSKAVAVHVRARALHRETWEEFDHLFNCSELFRIAERKYLNSTSTGICGSPEAAEELRKARSEAYRMRDWILHTHFEKCTTTISLRSLEFHDIDRVRFQTMAIFNTACCVALTPAEMLAFASQLVNIQRELEWPEPTNYKLRLSWAQFWSRSIGANLFRTQWTADHVVALVALCPCESSDTLHTTFNTRLDSFPYFSRDHRQWTPQSYAADSTLRRLHITMTSLTAAAQSTTLPPAMLAILIDEYLLSRFFELLDGIDDDGITYEEEAVMARYESCETRERARDEGTLVTTLLKRINPALQVALALLQNLADHDIGDALGVNEPEYTCTTTFIKGYFGENGGFDYAALSAADREALLAHVSGIEELEIRRTFLELSFGWIEQVAALPDQVRLLCAHCKGWCEPKTAAEEEEAEQEGQGQDDGLVIEAS